MRPLLARPSLLGAILAVLVGIGAYVYLADSDTDAGATEVETAQVVVAARDIGLRAQLQAADIELLTVPLSTVHPAAVLTLEQATGRYALGPIHAGQQVLSLAVGELPGGGALAQLVPDGMRALSVGVSDAIAAGGLLEPGDHVDIVAVFEEQRAGRNGAMQVAEDVEVLAVSAALLGAERPESDDRRPNPTSISATVTVALPPVIAQRVALAEEFGAIRVVLRRPGDDRLPAVQPVDLEQVTGAPPPAVIPATASELGN